MELTLSVGIEDDGRRAGDVLRARLGVTRTLAKRIRLHGRLLRDGAPIRMRDPVRAGDRIDAWLPDEGRGPDANLPEDVDASLPDRFAADGGRIVYRDGSLCVVDKPAGWLSHPTRSERRSVTEVVRALTGRATVHPVNRLDRGTSGLMAVALDPFAANALSKGTSDGALRREYVAWVRGIPSPPCGTIDAPIAHDAKAGPRRSVGPGGRASETEYRLEETRVLPAASGGGTVSRVRFVLRTGRTHQIRVHARHAGFPLVGDPLYGTQDEAPGGFQALHAAHLSLRHPVDGTLLAFESPMPEERSPFPTP